MPAHIRSALTQINLSIPIEDGALTLAHGKAFTCSSTEINLIAATLSTILLGRVFKLAFET